MSYKDFDQFFQEADKDRQPIKFKLYGKEYELPKKLPAKIILNIMYKQKSGELSDAEQFSLAMSIFNEDDVNEWVDNGLSVDELAELMKWAMEQYGESTKKKANQ